MKKLFILGIVMMFLVVGFVSAEDYEWITLYDHGEGEDNFSIGTQHSSTMTKESDHLYIQHGAGNYPRPGGSWVYDEALKFSKIDSIRYTVYLYTNRNKVKNHIK